MNANQIRVKPFRVELPGFLRSPRATRLFRLLSVLLTLLPFAGAGVRADQPDETLPFFRPDQAFESRRIDNINLFSGDIGVVIPLGPSYLLGPVTQWQMQAYASAKLWHLHQNCEFDPSMRFAYISGDPTLGVGWTLTPGFVQQGKYHSPDGSTHGLTDGSHLRITPIPVSNPTSYTVEFPDGTIHYFENQFAVPAPFSGVSSDFTYQDARSGNRFGLTRINDAFGTELLHVYYQGTKPWEFTSIVLMPAVNPRTITFTWMTQTVGFVQWRVLDKISFPSPSATTLQVDFNYMENGQSGTFPRNAFDLSNICTVGPCLSCNLSSAIYVPVLTSINLSDTSSPPKTRPFSYKFEYFAAPSTDPLPVQEQGALKKITLPSLGILEYDYSITAGFCEVGASGCDPEGSFPDQQTPTQPEAGPPGQQPYFDKTPGVASRKETDPFTSRAVTTTYSRKNFYVTTLPCPPCDADLNRVVRRTTVVGPGNDEAGPGQYAKRYYFHMAIQDDSVTQDNGLLLDERYFDGGDPTTSNVVRTIIQYGGYKGADPPGTFKSYAMTDRIPPDNVVTWFGAVPAGQDPTTCGGSVRCIKVLNSNYNTTAGKYGKTRITTTLPDSVDRTVETNWTPVNTPSDWFLDLFDHRFAWDGVSLPSGSDGQTVVRQYFSFDTTNGFLKGSWTWDSVVDKVIMNCRYNGGSGTVSGEFSQTYTSATEPTASNCPGSMPSISADSDTFGKDHTWTNLLLTKSNWRSGSGTIGWDSFDAFRDSNTGQITESRDPNYPTNSALKTSYTYDALGRVIMIQPPGGSAVEWPTTFCYLPGSGGYTPFVIVKKTTASPTLNPNDANGICKKDEGAPSTNSGSIEGYNYDGLGRLVREVRRSNHKFTGATYFSRRETRYDSAGHRRILSDWKACPSGQFADTDISACAVPNVVAPLDFPGNNLWLFNFDPLGRAQTLGNVNLGDTATYVTIDRTDNRVSPNIAFSDSRAKTTTFCVNGTWAPLVTCNGAGKKDAESATEWDALGRVRKVTEPNPSTGLLSSDTTSYSYQVLDKIYQVTQSPQTRTFQYLAFGFLEAETTPENGASGGATTNYDLYGSLGNLRQKTDPAGGTRYNYSYDVAGRLTLLTTGTSSPFTNYLVNCYDGTGTCGDSAVPNFAGGSYPKGRLTRRLGWNQMGFPATPVYDDFRYGDLSGTNCPSTDVSGRLCAQTTSIGQRGTDLAKNGFGLPVTQKWTYNVQGLVSTHVHPRPSGSSTSLTVNDSEVTSGLLTKVAAGWQGGGSQQIVTANYHQSGRLSDYTTGSSTPNVKTTITDDSVIPSRPATFTAVKSSGGALFQTGLYKYDGAGNIMNIGADAFTYDARSRITQATYSGQPTPQGFTYDRYGNLASKTGVNPVTLTATAGTNHIIGSTYDARGNLTFYPTVGPQQILSYDLLNRQFESIDNVLGTDFIYIYDGAGERVGKFPTIVGGALRRELARVIIEGRGDSPLTCTPDPFTDVTCAANPNDGKYVQEMKDIGITTGCGAGTYCPNAQISREEAAVFFLRGKKCPLNQIACTYAPPACTPGYFADVPCPSLYANWIQELAVEGITAGCGNGNFCPTAVLGSWNMLAWAQKIWPTYNPLPRATILTYRDEAARVATEGQSAGLYDASATISYPKDNVFLGSLLVGSATWAGTTPGWNFYASDHLGTPRLTTDVSASSAIETRKYWPYGDDGPTTGVDTMQRLRFATMERDIETKHYFDHARNHDFNLGRFKSPDLLVGLAEDPQSWNRYSYTLSNPLKYVDPTGLGSDLPPTCHSVVCQTETVLVTAAAPPPDRVSLGTLAFFANDFSKQLGLAVTDNGISRYFGVRAQAALQQGDYFSYTIDKIGEEGFTGGGLGFLLMMVGAPEAQGARIVFSEGGNHWFRHLLGSGLAKETVAAAVRADVSRQVGLQAVRGWYTGKITLGGREILYRAKPLVDGAINVGTAFFK